MFGIKFIKFDSMTYVVQFKNGKVNKEGRGLSFYYYAPSSSIAAIPIGSDDVQFIFNESTSDFQTISIQGSITYKIENPKLLADSLDFTVDAKGIYKKDDYNKLGQRLINEAQTSTSAFIQGIELKQALRSAKSIEEKIIKGLKESQAVLLLGLIPIGVNVIAVKPDPKTEKALEASTREALQKEADLATYERRNFGVEQERMIKESELSTEIAIEEKKKQIAEKQGETEVLKEENNRKLREMRLDADTAIEKKQMDNELAKEQNNRKIREIKIAADIVIEEDRKKLTAMEVENSKLKSDAKSYEIETSLQHYKDIDWKILMAMNPNGTSAQLQIALAFRELAENTQKIGTLNITPDLLQSLTQQINNPPVYNQGNEQDYR
jgi:hypothetical protein